MSDSLGDDRNARAGALAPLADVWTRQDDAVKLGGALTLWPLLGAQTMAVLAADTGPWGDIAAPGQPPVSLSVHGVAEDAAAADQPASDSVARPAGTRDNASVATLLPSSADMPVVFGHAATGAAVLTPAEAAFAAVQPAGTAISVIYTSDALIAPSPVAGTTAASITTLTVAQLNGVLAGLDNILSAVEQALSLQIYAEELPIIGTKLGAAATQAQTVVAEVKSLEAKVKSALQALSSVNLSATAVQNAIDGALSGAGFGNNAHVTLDPTSGSLTVGLAGTASETFSTALDSGFGLPGLNFQTTGSASTSLSYKLSVDATVDTSGNFALTDPSTAPALTLNLGVTAPSFGADASLGFLKFAAADKGSALNGTFTIDNTGAPTFSGNANLDVGLSSDMGSAALPSISADLTGGWSFAAGTVVDASSPSTFGGEPTIALSNVNLNIGNFVSNFLEPILTDVNSILDSAPIQQALTLFETPLTFLGGVTASDPSGNGGLLGPFWRTLDQAGALDANGNSIPDNEITLVDFLQLAGVDVAPLVQFLNTVTDLRNWASALTSDPFGGLLYSLGSFLVTGDARDPNMAPGSAAPDPNDPAQSLDALLQSLPVGGSSSAGIAGIPVTTATGISPAQALQSLLSSTQSLFSFPIIADAAKAAQFLLGGTVDLFDTNLPVQSIGFGAISAAGVPTSTVSLLPVPLNFPTPIPGLTLDLNLGAAFQGTFGLNFGYDTKGLSEYASGGFKDPANIVDGLFVQAPTVSGVVQPVLQLAGDVQMGATLSALFGLASAGGSGDIGGNLDLTFAQAGKNYLTTLANEISSTGNPFSIFDSSGKITAGFEASANFGPASWFYPSPRVTLATFGAGSGPAGGVGSVLAPPDHTIWTGGATGDFETAGNWSPTFVAIGGTDYYGDGTIATASTVAFQGQAPADLASLTLGKSATLGLTAGQLTLENTTDSTIGGELSVIGSAQLLVKYNIDNTGVISLDGGTLVAAGVVQIYGGGNVLLDGASGGFLQGSDANAVVLNTDNMIAGDGTVGTMLFNDAKGVVLSDDTKRLVLTAADTNAGTFEAGGNKGAAGTARTGGLDIVSSLDNSGGTLVAFQNGQIILENGVTLSGGTLITNGVPDGSAIITADNSTVTLDGGTAGMINVASVVAGTTSMLTLTGTIASALYSTTLGQTVFDSGAGQIALLNATLKNGYLDAPVDGAIQVSGTTTIDGSKGDESFAVSGLVGVAAGNTLVIDGSVNPGPASGGFELSGGTLVVGNATTDAATFGLDGSGNGGLLPMDDGTGSAITGADGSSVLTNNWTVAGSGQFGDDQLTIDNAAKGIISGTGANALVVQGAGTLTNAGWIGGLGGTVDLKGIVSNAGGTIGAADGTTDLDSASILGGTLTTSGSGVIHAMGAVLFDGTGNEVTIAAGANVVEDPGTTITIEGGFDNKGTMTVAGTTAPGEAHLFVGAGNPPGGSIYFHNDGLVQLNGPGAAMVANTDTVLIDGSGTIAMSQADLGGRVFTDPTHLDTIENLTETIEGSGVIGLDGTVNAVALTNDGIITASDATAPLTLNAQIVNTDQLSSSDGGRLILTGTVNNQAALLFGLSGALIEAAAGSTVELAQVTVTGGNITADATGQIEVAANSTLDGTNTGVTTAGVTLSGAAIVDAGAALTLLGVLKNKGTLSVSGNGGAGTGATIVVSGSVTLKDGGTVSLADGSATGSSTTQVITGTASSDTLDNIDNTIAGAGLLGSGLLTLENEVSGTIEAKAGALTVDTGTNQVGNAGLLEAAGGGTLVLSSNVNDVNATIGANGGAVDLAGITVTGGQFVALPGGTIHVQGTSTLDASASAVTIAAGAPMAVDPGATLTLKGTFADNGTLSVTGDGTAANDGEVLISGHVTLGGTGTLDMAYLPGGGQIVPYLMQSVASDGTLDHVGGTISGSGAINLAGLTNEAGAVIDANNGYGGLDVSAFTTIANLGLMEATANAQTSGRLSIDSALANSGMILAAAGSSVDIDAAVANSGTILAQSGGGVSIDRGMTVTNTGLVEAASGNAAIDLGGVIAGAHSNTQILGTGRLEFSGGTGTLSGGGLSVAAGGTVQFDSSTTGGELSNIAVSNAGTIDILGRDSNPQVTPVAAMRIDGTVSLSGGGLVVLTDESGTDDPTSQVITGTTGGATLDNIDNTIAGYGQLGAGALTLINEKAGTIEATGGTIVLDTGAVAATNKGLMEALGGTLTVRTVLDGTGGGTVSALNNGGTASGVILLDGGTLRGGTVTTDLKDAASAVEVTANSGTLDGTAGTLTLAAGANVLVGATQSLTATGAIANFGTILVAGNPYAGTAELRIAGTATLSGGGLVSLSDASGNFSPSTEIVTGASAAATLDNASQTIAGYGQLGGGTLTLINGARGTIDATGGTLTVDTGANTTVNQGLIEAVGGLLVQRGVVDDTKGGIISALNTGGTAGVSGTVLLDGATLRGGTIVTDLTDRNSVLEVSGNGGTLDGTAGAVTIVTGAQAVVGGTLTMTAKGAIANSGTLEVAGNPYSGVATLKLAGTVTLTGGGLVSMIDVSGNASAEQAITGTVAADTLDNIDNLISGYGALGAGTLTLQNQTKGTVEAIGGILTVDTGANAVTNKGLMEAVGGMLILRETVDGTNGGTVSALNNGGSVSGVVLLDGGTLRGGTFTSDLKDPASALEVTANGGTLDGTAGTVTIASGAQAVVSGTLTMTAKGMIANSGTIGVDGNPYAGVATLRVSGAVTLDGGGMVSMVDTSGNAAGSTQAIAGAASSSSLDNIDNLISGYGSLGAGTLTLTNEVKGTIKAIGGVLTVDTGANTATNKGLMEAIGGTLQLATNVANSGTILAGAAGGVVVAAAVANTGLAEAASGGTLTVQGTVDGTASSVKVLAGGTLVLDGGLLSGGTLTNAATGVVDVTTNGGTLTNLAIVNAGSLNVIGNPYAGTAVAHIGGTVTLSGGGAVTLFDASGNFASSTQVVTGTKSSDTLDNVDNLISGYGQLGGGVLTLINEAKGTIEATGGLLVVDTGTTTATNRGLLEAVGGTLDLRSVVDETSGGAVEALNNGGTTSGVVLLDGATLLGGTISTDLKDAASVVETAGTLASTLDGTAAAITFATGAHVQINPAQTLIAKGTIANQGTLSVIGNVYSGADSELNVSGTLTLSGGGLVSLEEASGNNSAVQEIVGAAASSTLDNIDNLISGYGMLGAGTLALTNELKGTIDATVGVLTLDTGTNTAVNHGLMQALGGTLQLNTALSNDGSITAGAGGGVVVAAALSNAGVITAASGGTLTVRGMVSGASSDVTVASGGALILDGGTISGGVLHNAANATIDVTTGGGLFDSLTIDNAGSFSVAGNPYSGVVAEKVIGGTVTLSGGGTVSLLDASGLNSSASQGITGATDSATLDNIDNLITGYGLLGAGKMTLDNEAKGTIEATVATLVADTGANLIVNKGLMEAVGGTLQVASGLTNSGTVLAGAAGDVIVAGAMTSTGLAEALNGGTLTVGGAISGASSTVTVAAGGTLVVDGGTLSGGTVSNAAKGAIQVTTNGGTLADLALTNAGTLSIIGNPYSGKVATVNIAGTVTLSGGGTVSMLDVSGLNDASQEITASVVGATLDNVDNTISGYGTLGAGLLTLVNESKGTVEAAIGTLTADFTTVGMTNQGLMEANGGTLVLRGVIDGTQGGTIAALSNGGTSGVVSLDGATLRGGTIATDEKDPESLVELTSNGGTLDGTAGAVTLAAGAQILVSGAQTLTASGTIADEGTITLAGNPYSGAATELRVGGTVTLTGGGAIAMSDISGLFSTSAQSIIGGTASDTLDIAHGRVSGFGQLGAGTLTLINEAAGTIDASGGTLTVDTGANTVTSQGLLTADIGGVLDLRSNVANAGVLAAEGTVTNEATLTNTGDLIADGLFSNANTVMGGATVSASGTFANLVGAVVTGTVAAFGTGGTISNLGTIDGVVTMTGGDRLVTGAGAVFAGGITGGSGGNTLEIASGPYTLTNFNAPGTPQYSTLQIDAGVTLITDGSDNLSGIALNNDGIIDLTAFEADSPFQNAGEIVGDITLSAGVPLTNSAGGVISGAGLAVIEALGPASVMNAGMIDPATYGVDLMAGGTVTNAAGGTIDGTVAGVLVTGGAGTVITGGSIIGGGTDAVSLPAGYANRVILDPGAAFMGLVDGGNPAGGTIASVLELGGVAGSTKLSGLGSQFVGFGTVAIDSGAYVLLSGANTLGAGVALTDAGVFSIKGGASLTEASAGVVSGSLTTVDGVGSSWNAAGGLVVGGPGGASLVVSGKGSLGAAGSLTALVLGSAAGGTGALTVTGTGSRATLTGQVNVGQAGGGVLTVANQGTAFTGGSALAPSAGIDAASAAGGAGTIAVTGTRSLLHNTGAFIVGDAGVGDLAISGGGTVITSPGTVAGLAGLVIGASAGAAGSSAEVSGAGSRLDVTGLLDVGIDGSAGLLIDGGATVTAASLDAANLATAVGEVTLSDPGTALIVSGDATVSDDGTGVLSVLNGASFSARSLTIGSQTDSSGALVVSGNNTTLTVSGELNIGTALGTGDLTVGPGAVVNASVVNLQGGVVLEGGLLDPTVYIENGGSTTGGFGTVSSQFILLEGTILSNGGKSGKQTEVVQGTVVGGGTATINGSVSVNGPGILQIGTHDTIELTGAVLNAATTTFTDNLTPTGTYTVNNSVIDVVFQDTTGVLQLDDIAGFAGTVTTWKAGDSFVITGGTLSNIGVSNGDTLTVHDSGTEAGAGGIDSIIFGSAIGAGGFSIVNGNTVQAVACFAEGTRIRTEQGDLAIEQLAAGDHAVTADGACEPIVWIGHRAVNCRAHPAPEQVWPVCVRAGAFGEAVPVRDLYLSPDHAVFVNGVLVPVKLLIDGTRVVQVKRERVRYFHVELPRHAIILAEGLTVESYLDLGDRANFHQNGETIRLFPDFAARLAPKTAMLWETKGAAPLVLAGEALEAARRTVAVAVSRAAIPVHERDVMATIAIR